MTKMTATKKARKGIAPLPMPALEKRNFTPEEMLEFHEMLRLVNSRKFEAAQVKGNTALIPRGQEVAAELEALSRLMENAKNMWISQKLGQCGYAEGAKCNINMTTGEITLSADAPADDQKPQ